MDHELTTVSPHFTRLQLGKAVVWYSYSTPIGVSDGRHIYTRENLWSANTGRHLNHIDNGNKAGRLTTPRFLDLLEQIVVKGVTAQ